MESSEIGRMNVMEGKSKLQRWAALLGGLALILFVCQVVAPYANAHLPWMDRLILVTEAKNIDPGEFWYTDVEVSGEAIVFTTSSTDPALSVSK